MKISDLNQNGNAIQYIQQNGKTNPVEKNHLPKEVQDSFSPRDKVDLSAESKEMKKIHDVLAITPDVRTERVAEIKKLIETGKYEVKSEAIADKMIKEFLQELGS